LQLATFGVISPSWLGRHGGRRYRYGNRSVAEIADRAQHFQPVPERNAKIFEMLIGQVGENGHINVILGTPGTPSRWCADREASSGDQQSTMAGAPWRPARVTDASDSLACSLLLLS
jgi:hypothetical protein